MWQVQRKNKKKNLIQSGVSSIFPSFDLMCSLYDRKTFCVIFSLDRDKDHSIPHHHLKCWPHLCVLISKLKHDYLYPIQLHQNKHMILYLLLIMIMS